MKKKKWLSTEGVEMVMPKPFRKFIEAKKNTKCQCGNGFARTQATFSSGITVTRCDKCHNEDLKNEKHQN